MIPWSKSSNTGRWGGAMPEQSVAAPSVGTTAPQQSKPSALKRLFQVVVTYVWFIGALFASAGRLNWTRGWVSVVLSVIGMTSLGLIVQRYNPELMAERARWRRKDTKRFDNIFMALYLPLVLLHPAIAGLDAVRFHWSSMPFAFMYVGAAMFVTSLVVIGSVMVVNPYAETSVRIQTDRCQTVVTTGPYRFVRHPMYVGTILMGVANPLLWGSVWGAGSGPGSSACCSSGALLTKIRLFSGNFPVTKISPRTRAIGCCRECGESLPKERNRLWMIKRSTAGAVPAAWPQSPCFLSSSPFTSCGPASPASRTRRRSPTSPPPTARTS